jgi:hypothetical protein
LTGVVMHRDRGMEKTVEIRLEDVAQIDQMNMELSTHEGPRLTILLHKCTRQQLKALVKAMEEQPGTHEAFIQVLPTQSYLPFSTNRFVDPTEEWLEKVKSLVPGCKIEFESLTSQYEEVSR